MYTMNADPFFIITECQYPVTCSQHDDGDGDGIETMIVLLVV